MAYYIVIMKGEGEGCDYTIGCNMKYKFVDSNLSLADLAVKLAEQMTDPSEYSDPEIKELIVVPYDAAVVPDLTPFKQKHREAGEAEKRALQEEKEKQELARLLAKHGGLS